MKKIYTTAIFVALVCSGCTISNPTQGDINDLPIIVDEDNDVKPGENQENPGIPGGNSQNPGQNGDNGQNSNEHQNTSDEGGNTTPGSYQYSLDNYTEFKWHNGHKPCYAPDWEYHIKDTINPLNSAFWENPNESVDYSGVQFKDRNSYIISPTFKSWQKTEVRFTFWASSISKSGSTTEPQMLVQEYSKDDVLLGTESIYISRSDVPSNSTPILKTLYLRNASMSYFILKFNSYIPNGDNGYCVILSEATLKGWPNP